MFEPVSPVRAYERVVEQIEDAVRRGDLQAGARLPSERDLMKEFQVSRSTVREALRVLQSNGVLRSRPGDPNGAELLELGPDVLRGPLLRLVGSDRVSRLDLLQYRILLEGATSYLAAISRTDEELADMQVLLEALGRSVQEGPAAWGRADAAFHDAIARASGNPLLHVCTEVVRSVTEGMIRDKIERSPDPSGLMHQWVHVHSRMFDAIRDADARRARACAQSDLFEGYAEFLEPAERELLREWLEVEGDRQPPG